MGASAKHATASGVLSFVSLLFVTSSLFFFIGKCQTMWQISKLILLIGLFRKEFAFLWMERHQRVHHPLEMGVCHRCTRHCRLMGPPGTFFLFTFCNNSTQRRALSTSGALLALIVGFTLSLAHYSFFLRFFVCKIESLMTTRLSPACLPSSSAPAGRPSTSRI